MPMKDRGKHHDLPAEHPELEVELRLFPAEAFERVPISANVEERLARDAERSMTYRDDWERCIAFDAIHVHAPEDVIPPDRRSVSLVAEKSCRAEHSVRAFPLGSGA